MRKIHEGRPNLLDHLANGAIALIVNTPSGKGARTDEGRIRAAAVSHGVPCITTIAGAKAAVAALERLRAGKLDVYALQDLLQSKVQSKEPATPRPADDLGGSPMASLSPPRATLDDLYREEGKAELIGGRIVRSHAFGRPAEPRGVRDRREPPRARPTDRPGRRLR